MLLFIINELHLPEKLAGYDDGHRRRAGDSHNVLIAGYFAKRLGKRLLYRARRCRRTVLLWVCCVGAGNVARLAVAERDLQRHSWRDWHALFSGSDAVPCGSATTLYATITIRVGWIIAGSLAGIAAEIWNYHAVFWFALVMIAPPCSCPRAY